MSCHLGVVHFHFHFEVHSDSWIFQRSHWPFKVCKPDLIDHLRCASQSLLLSESWFLIRSRWRHHTRIDHSTFWLRARARAQILARASIQSFPLFALDFHPFFFTRPFTQKRSGGGIRTADLPCRGWRSRPLDHHGPYFWLIYLICCNIHVLYLNCYFYSNCCKL